MIHARYNHVDVNNQQPNFQFIIIAMIFIFTKYLKYFLPTTLMVLHFIITHEKRHAKLIKMYGDIDIK